MFDLDQKGYLIGIEFIGQKDFSIRELLRNAPIEVSVKSGQPHVYRRNPDSLPL